MLKDISVSAVVAGFVAILIGFSSSVSIIIQAAYARRSECRDCCFVDHGAWHRGWE